MPRCGKYDYSTYQAMTGILLNEFRKYKSQITVSFNILGRTRLRRYSAGDLKKHGSGSGKRSDCGPQ